MVVLEDEVAVLEHLEVELKDLTALLGGTEFFHEIRLI